MFEVHAVERPYPGLRPFEAWESSIFFGREAHTDRLLEILDTQHFLVVMGPSGSGKSSLVRAGLVPALPLGTIGRGAAWRVALMRPGDRPLRHLTQSLLAPGAFGPEIERLSSPDDDGGPDHSAAHLHAELLRGARGLIDLVADMRRQAVGHDFDLLVLVDQFEEIFTYARAGSRDANEADAFVNLLLGAAASKDSGIHVVLTMRTDFLGACTQFPDLPEAINGAGYLTPRLSRADLARAIAAPARVFGGNLDASLTGELVNAVHEDPDQLPVLQHALARMWDRRAAAGEAQPVLTLQDLKAVGGIGSALSDHADEVVRLLMPSDPASPVAPRQLQIQWLFRCLSDQRSADAGGQLVRRPQSLALVEQASGIAWLDFVPVLQAFGRMSVSFLTYAGQPGEPAQGSETVVDISHEALLRQWAQLRKWVAAEARAAARYRELQRRTAQGGAPLTGADLQRAADWFHAGLGFEVDRGGGDASKVTAAWAARYAGDASFDDVEAFYRKSRDEANQQTRRARRTTLALRGVVALVFVLGVGSALVGRWGYERAMDANAQTMWLRLAFDNRGAVYTEEVTSGLLALARADREVRATTVLKWLGDEVMARQLANSRHYLLNGALGIDDDLRRRLVDAAFRNADEASGEQLRARAHLVLQLELVDRLDLVVRTLGETNDPVAVSSLGRGLETLAPRLPASAAAGLAQRVVDAVGKSENADQQTQFARVLAVVPGGLSDAQFDSVTQRLLGLMQHGTDRDTSVLGSALATLSAGLGEARIQAVYERWFALIGEAHDRNRAINLALGLGPLTDRVTNAQLRYFIERAGEKPSEETPQSSVLQWGPSLTQLAAKISDARTEAWAVLLFDEIGKRTSRHRPQQGARHANKAAVADIPSVDNMAPIWLGQALAAVTRRMTESQADHLAGQLLDAMDKSQDSYVAQSGYGQSLAAALGRLGDERVQQHARRMLERMEGPKRDNAAFFDPRARVLQGVVDMLTDEQAQVVSRRFLEALAPLDSARTAVYRPRVYPNVWVRSAGPRDPAQGDTASQLITQIKLHTYEFGPPEALIYCFRKAVDKLGEARLMSLAEQVLLEISNTSGYYDTRQANETTRMLVVLTDKLGPTPATLQLVSRYVDTLGQRSSNTYAYFSPNGDSAEDYLEVRNAMLRALSDDQAVKWVGDTIDSIGKTTDMSRLSGYGEGLEAVVGRRGAAQAQVWAERLVEVIGRTENNSQVNALDKGLLAATGSLTDPQMQALTDRMLTISATQTSNGAAYLPGLASRWASRVIKRPDAIARWVDLCKSPFVDRPSVIAAVRAVDPAGPAQNEGEFAYLDWAAKKYGVDVRASLKSPRAGG